MCGVLSFFATRAASWSMIGASSAAACSGASGVPVAFAVNSVGSAVMSYASTLVASSTPLRSVISPRTAASVRPT